MRYNFNEEKGKKESFFDYQNIYPFNQRKDEKSKYHSRGFWIEEALKVAFKGVLGLIGGYLLFLLFKVI